MKVCYAEEMRNIDRLASSKYGLPSIVLMENAAISCVKYLEKFGLEVICIDSDAQQKVLSDAENLIKNNTINYIYLFKGAEKNENTEKLIEKYTEIKTIELHRLDNITDDERREKEDYQTIMRDNLELIKKELYQ